MLLKCWVRFQPSSERVRRVGPGPPLEPSLRLPAAPEGKGGGRMEAGETLWERVSVGRAAEAWRLVAVKRPKWQAKIWHVRETRKVKGTDIPRYRDKEEEGWMDISKAQMQSRYPRGTEQGWQDKPETLLLHWGVLTFKWQTRQWLLEKMLLLVQS